MTEIANDGRKAASWLSWLSATKWLSSYRSAWLSGDLAAGVTLAAYAIPVSLAYATLAGLPPQVGVYGYLLGGLGYALFGSSRQLAIGPTSAISLMVAGTVGAMANGDTERYFEIASLAAFTVAGLCLLAWLFRLSALVKLISDSILVGFKIGAGLTIAMTQLPSLFGVAGGGHNFFERIVVLAGQLNQTQYLVVAIGVIAIILLVIGDRLLPGKPVALGVVALAIIIATAFGFQALGVPTTGKIPAGLPALSGPALRNPRRRGDSSLGGRLSATRLYRGRIGRSHICSKTWISVGPTPGVPRTGFCKFVRGDRPWLSRCWRFVPVCGERQGRCADPARAGLRIGGACVVPSFSHRISGKSSEGRIGSCRADRNFGSIRFSIVAAHVAR